MKNSIRSDDSKKRIEWLDVAKFLGIFAIYLGHFGNASGYGFEFVFTFHVPMFFLLSGCSECFSKEKSFLKYFLKKVKSLLIPYVLFSILILIFICLKENCYLNKVREYFLGFLLGAIRNGIFGGTIWFLTCLFTMSIMFYFIKKVKFKTIILAICIALHVIEVKFLFLKPVFFNFNSALYYIIYYAIGYIAYEKINLYFDSKKLFSKVTFAITFIVSFVYSALLFFLKDPLYKLESINELTVIITPLIRACIVIYFFLAVAYLLRNIKLFANIGKSTLYLCGNELLIRNSLPLILQAIGLNMVLQNPIHAYIYTIIFIFVGYRFLMPFEKKVLDKIYEKFSILTKNKKKNVNYKKIKAN